MTAEDARLRLLRIPACRPCRDVIAGMVGWWKLTRNAREGDKVVGEWWTRAGFGDLLMPRSRG